MESKLIVLTRGSEYHIVGGQVTRAFSRPAYREVELRGTLTLVSGRPRTDERMSLDYVDGKGRRACVLTSSVILAA